jgi:hypothetical protein
MSGRLEREKTTVRAMIRMYCAGQHRNGDLCAECEALHAYAMQRIDKCPFEECKPTCATCHVHCYKPALREQIRQVMRYAGPRMPPSGTTLTSGPEAAPPCQRRRTRPGPELLATP